VLRQYEAWLLMYGGRQGGVVCSWCGGVLWGRCVMGVLLFELYDEVFDDGRTDPCDECRPLTRAPLRATSSAVCFEPAAPGACPILGGAGVLPAIPAICRHLLHACVCVCVRATQSCG
jgi:hypothetical protein